MSVSTEVQRTLVKSPPELWSELSNPEALARHLAELGEIRITSVEPETKVEWETDGASGVVHLKQSGWGTKVTLSLTRETKDPEEPPQPQQIAECEPTAPFESEAIIEAEPEVLAESEASTETEPESVAEPQVVAEAVAEPEPTVVLATEPRPGFFARLFGRRRAKSIELAKPASNPEPAPDVPEVTPEPEVVALAAPEPIYPEPTPKSVEPAGDLAAELASVEAQMVQDTTALLTGVLDRLGAAHHRPFSRS
jgi:hypothetical protein